MLCGEQVAAGKLGEALGRERQLGDGAPTAHGVVDRLRHSRPDGDETNFSDSLRLERVIRRGSILTDEQLNGRCLGRRREQVVDERRRERLALSVVREFFEQRTPIPWAAAPMTCPSVVCGLTTRPASQVV